MAPQKSLSPSFFRTQQQQVFAITWILGAFTKLPRAVIGFVMSVRPHVTSRFLQDGFS
jgi:hypothetical protein